MELNFNISMDQCLYLRWFACRITSYWRKLTKQSASLLFSSMNQLPDDWSRSILRIIRLTFKHVIYYFKKILSKFLSHVARTFENTGWITCDHLFNFFYLLYITFIQMIFQNIKNNNKQWFFFSRVYFLNNILNNLEGSETLDKQDLCISFLFIF